MLVEGHHRRTITLSEELGQGCCTIIDQRRLPFQVVLEPLRETGEFCEAIGSMHVRGAGCIGVTAGYGMYCAAVEAANATQDAAGFLEHLRSSASKLLSTRPTAANLKWAISRQLRAVEEALSGGVEHMVSTSRSTAVEIDNEDVEWCQAIGEHGLQLIKDLSSKKPAGEPVNILTHCNAGWLAFADYGTATGPIYAAQTAGIDVHVWVDETRPRNQGAFLTAWELGQQGVKHTVIADNTGGHLMQHGMVDMVIVGADRVTYTGDVANKIGTYLKALAAKDCNVPFYVAFGSSAFDWECEDGVKDIPIEQRSPTEVATIVGKTKAGELECVCVIAEGSAAANYAFDVTPGRLVTGLITERGICSATEEGVRGLYPEAKAFNTEYSAVNCAYN